MHLNADTIINEYGLVKMLYYSCDLEMIILKCMTMIMPFVDRFSAFEINEEHAFEVENIYAIMSFIG